MGAVFGWMQWERFAKARGGFDMAGGVNVSFTKDWRKIICCMVVV